MNSTNKSRVSDIIESIFSMYDNEEDPLTDYVSCIDLTPVRRIAFVFHDDRRVEQASKLSLCAHLTNNMRWCVTRLIGYRYRRLENYTSYCGFAVHKNGRWYGHGKLIEVTLYYKYESRNPRWSRHLEIRLYFVVPIHFKDYVSLFDNFIDVFDNVARALAEYNDLEYAHDMELEEDRMEEMKHGIREVSINMLSQDFREDIVALHAKSCLTKSWCNSIVRAVYGYSYAIIHDYRGYTWRIPHAEASQFFETLYAYLYDYFKWW